MENPSPSPPKRSFNAAVGVRKGRILTERPPFIRRGRSSGRFAVGIRYERRALEALALKALGREDLAFLKSPWIEFWDQSGRRWCQPDGVMVREERGIGVIYEIKYQHTSDAWWQLRWLYEPVLSVLYPSIRFGLVEICHWHDPATSFPEPYDLTDDPFRVPHANRVAVHIWNPNRSKRG